MNLGPCTAPGCGRSRAGKGRFCEECAPTAPNRQGSASSRGYGARWRRVRDWFLKRYPYCLRCDRLGRPVTPAKEVHHVTPRRDGGGDQDANLASLCTTCHRILTVLETTQGADAARLELRNPREKDSER